MEFVGYPGKPIDSAPENKATLDHYTVQYSIGDVTDEESWVYLMNGLEEANAVMADFEGSMNRWAKKIAEDSVEKCGAATEAPATEAPKTDAPAQPEPSQPSPSSESNANNFVLPLSILAVLAFA